MFGAFVVWVLLVYSQGYVPVGTFSTKEKCILASGEMVEVMNGKEQLKQLNIGLCVPVEKTLAR